MARMQKKKPADQKKKQKESGDSVSGSADNISADSTGKSAGGSSVIADSSKKSKPAYSAGAGRKSSQQSAVLKLIDRYFGTWIQFLREVKVELSKVAWPSRKETIGTTAVVLVFVFIIAIFLGIVDMGLSSLVRLII